MKSFRVVTLKIKLLYSLILICNRNGLPPRNQFMADELGEEMGDNYLGELHRGKKAPCTREGRHPPSRQGEDGMCVLTVTVTEA